MENLLTRPKIYNGGKILDKSAKRCNNRTRAGDLRYRQPARFTGPIEIIQSERYSGCFVSSDKISPFFRSFPPTGLSSSLLRLFTCPSRLCLPSNGLALPPRNCTAVEFNYVWNSALIKFDRTNPRVCCRVCPRNAYETRVHPAAGIMQIKLPSMPVSPKFYRPELGIVSFRVPTKNPRCKKSRRRPEICELFDSELPSSFSRSTPELPLDSLKESTDVLVHAQ